MAFDEKLYMKEYRKNNREKIYSCQREWHKKMMQDPEYRARKAAYQRNHRAKTEQTEEQKIKARQRVAAWKKANAGRVIASTTKRKARVKQRTPMWLDSVDYFEIECVYMYCNALRKIGLNYEVDHIIPLLGKKVSGLHVPGNLQVIHKKDNSSKANKFEVI